MYRHPALPYGHGDRILVVGAGPAGAAAAEELRLLGFDGHVTVLCDEFTGPYDRPACSKGLLNGHQRPSDVMIPIADHLDIDWRLGRQAVSCDFHDRVVYTDTEEGFAFDGLVIATGSRPALPKGWPDEPGVHLLHSVDEAWKLRQELRLAGRVAIVGAGLTGCEVACAVRELAREAVLIDPRPYLMGRAVGEQVGGMIAEEHRKAGVELRLGSRVASVDRRRGKWRLVLTDGSEVEADLVVATLGERPDTGWLAGSGLDVSNGVLCDETLAVRGVEGVVAAGALARWPNLRYSAQPQLVGQWISAMEQGRAAANTLLADDDGYLSPVTVVPRFWSQQLGLRIQVCGDLPADADVLLTEMRPDRRDVARAGVLASYYDDGRLTGLVAVNAARAFTTTARAMILNDHLFAARAEATWSDAPVQRSRLLAVS
jgi:NADPH-dependent 2,4-dienoyl-CoA reductase/sulfur reductase-like enzyme